MKTVTLLGLYFVPGIVIAILCSNKSITKPFIHLADDHPFSLEYFLGKTHGLLEPWQSYISSIFGPLDGVNPVSYDIAVVWNRLTKMTNRHAAGLAAKSGSGNRDDGVSGNEEMGDPRTKLDPKIAKRVKKAVEKRSRAVPQNLLSGTSLRATRSTQSVQPSTYDAKTESIPETPAATLPGHGNSLTEKVAQSKQKVSKSKSARLTPRDRILASAWLWSHPGLEEDEAVPGYNSGTPNSVQAPNRDLGIDGASETPSASITITLPGRVDDISAPRPARVLLISEKEWSANPAVKPIDPN